MKRLRRLVLALVSLVLLAAPGLARAEWTEPVGGPSPINRFDFAGFGPHGIDPPVQPQAMAVVGGDPWIAWTEWDGENPEVRVARLNDAGTAWEEVGTGPSPINRDPARNAGIDVDLFADGNTPYVAWSEQNTRPSGQPGGSPQARVARLEGGEWTEIVGGATPINFYKPDGAGNANGGEAPDVTVYRGRPYVAYLQHTSDVELRTARLNDDGTAWEHFGGSLDSNRARAAELVVAGDRLFLGSASRAFSTGIRLRVLNPFAPQWDRLDPQPEVYGDSYTQPVDHDLTVAGERPHALYQDGLRALDLAGGGFNEVVATGSVPLGELGTVHDIPVAGAVTAAGDQRELRLWRVQGGRFREVLDSDGAIARAAQPSGREALHGPAIVDVGGMPYVGWSEWDGSTYQRRVARLEPAIGDPRVSVTQDGATVSAEVVDYAFPLPVAVEWGRGSSLDRRTAVQRTSGLAFGERVSFQLPGLAPGTAYSWRMVGWDGKRVAGAGPVGTFTTASAPTGTGAQAPEGTAPGVSACSGRARFDRSLREVRRRVARHFAALRRRGRLTARVSACAAGTLRIRVELRQRFGSGRAGLLVGRLSQRFTGRGTRRATLRLTRRGRAALRSGPADARPRLGFDGEFAPAPEATVPAGG